MFRSLFILGLALLVAAGRIAAAVEPLDVWPDLAPGETTRLTGETLPARPGENPPITRVSNVTRPTMTVHKAAKPNGTGVVILPGGGFSRVVPDLEGTEAADWLNQHGVTAFVLSYRTTADPKTPGWPKPLQDAERALSLIRAQAEQYGLQPNRIGLVGFSAGGQVAARLLTNDGKKRSYERIDIVDDTSCRPDFSILIYPWNMYDAKTDALVEGIEPPKSCPPTYIVHTDDDRSSSLGAVLFYAGLKKHGIPAELHVYGNGGHGYGLRPQKDSQISSWPDHAAHWLGTRGFLK
ncbi:alpha/beta hydrolase [Anatilimnocola floriformis]|uniref:alpha/beta hydrolase n=1 Tax=Anatilimnocola floriformis TaxID=2948575 RepID=UPI0020C4CE23|nr:alpha/beta hydrolase [Anatilimnocola floriformis]